VYLAASGDMIRGIAPGGAQESQWIAIARRLKK